MHSIIEKLKVLMKFQEKPFKYDFRQKIPVIKIK